LLWRPGERPRELFACHFSTPRPRAAAFTTGGGSVIRDNRAREEIVDIAFALSGEADARLAPRAAQWATPNAHAHSAECLPSFRNTRCIQQLFCQFEECVIEIG